MKVKEYEKFRAYYCGLCHTISERAGQAARLVLSYDSVFLAVFLDSLHKPNNTKIKAVRCLRHPINKRLSCFDSVCLDYSADINIILAWYNLKDKYIDGEQLKAIPAMAALKGAFNKCRKRNENLCKVVESYLDQLHKLEKEKSGNLDLVSETFANILKEIACPEFLKTSDIVKEAIRWFGYNLGKWLYLVDAFDDITQDVGKNNYNPFIYRYEYNPNKQNPDEFKKSIRDKVEPVLLNCLDQISKAYELVDIYANAGIIENIIYMGMLNRTDKVLQGVIENNEKSV